MLWRGRACVRNREADIVLVLYTHIHVQLVFQLCEEVNDLLNVLPFFLILCGILRLSVAISANVNPLRVPITSHRNFRISHRNHLKTVWNACVCIQYSHCTVGFVYSPVFGHIYKF